MFTSNKTPPAQGVKRSRTYGRQTRPLSRGLDDFVEGQDFVFAQRNAPKRTYSANTVKTITSLPTRDISGVSPSQTSPKASAVFVAAKSSAVTSTRSTAKPSLQNAGTKTSSSSVKSVKRAPPQPSIFDPPSSDDEPEHYLLLASKLKKGPAKTAVTATSSLTEFVEKRVKDDGVVKSNIRPKLVKSATEASRPTVKAVNIFDLQSSEEERKSNSTELKRKRPVMHRAATTVPISPPKIVAPQSAAGPSTQDSMTTPPHAKRPRLSLNDLTMSPATTPPPPASDSTKPSPRRTPKRTKTSPPKLMQNERSAPAVLTTMIRQPIESPVCSMPDVPIEYIESPKRRHSSASNRPDTPIIPVLSPKRTPGTTPRQEKLWGALLRDNSPSPPHAISPSHSSDLIASEVNQPPPRRRLVDVLKTAVEPSSDIAASDDMEDDDGVEIEGEEDSQSLLPQRTQASHTTESQNAHLKVTYASQRSFLAAPEDLMEDFSQPLDDFAGLTVPTLPGMSQNRSNDVSTHPSDDEEEEASKAMQSLHELRAAGGSRRFEDEIPLGDLEGSGKAATSRRRAALMEICNKLILDNDFLRKFSQSEIVCLVLHRCHSEKDQITMAIVAVVVALVLQDAKSNATATAIYKTGVMECLLRCLDGSRNLLTIAKDRASNMSKASQQAVQELQGRVCSSKLWGELCVATVSPKLLALQALEILIRRLREAGNREGLLNKELLSGLLKILDDVSNVTNQFIYDKDKGTQNKLLQELILSVMESFVVVEACNLNLELWDAWNLRRLVESLELIVTKDNCPESTQQLILRICISLANNNARISDVFAQPTLIAKFVMIVNDSFDKIKDLPIDQGLLLLDRLVLGLGALINLAEWSDEVRVILLQKETPQLNDLIKTFTFSRACAEEADSLERSQINVAYGYLAILLGNLSQNKQVKDHIRNQLPGKSLMSLIAAIDEFVLHHQRTDQLGESAGDGAWAAFTERLRAVADVLKADI